MNRAEEKTEKMKAKSQALDEMIDSGVLTDYTSNKDDVIERELEETTVKGSVEEELAKLKAEKARKKKVSSEEEKEEEAAQVVQ
jgi:phage shock protein A